MIKVFIRFGMHRDIQAIRDRANDIDGLVLPAHILADQTAPTSVFIGSVPQLPYLIDPMTIIMQNEKSSMVNESGDLRRSIGKLFNEYHAELGDKINRLGAGKTLTPSDLPNIKELCGNVLNFQMTAVATGYELSSAGKYLERYESSSPRPPIMIIPPYYFFVSVNSEWYDYSLECARITADMVGNNTMPVICCNSSILSVVSIQKIVDDYKDFSNVIVWIDNYNQTIAKVRDIKRVRKLIERLSENKEDVISLYGGYLMMVSNVDGLTGISHGVLYTQHKSVDLLPGSVSADSGGPPDRYYLPDLREFRSLSQVDYIIRKFPELICNCDICNEIIAGNPDRLILFEDDPELLRKHVMSVRRGEKEYIENVDIKDVVIALEDVHGRYNDVIKELPNPDAIIEGSKMKGIDYLLTWSAAFK